ncbi:MAG: histone deacetylase family protein [Proteobacteria bacterium]|jgi:acetoin utilization deacetylase AcuC-like enzyme|nr:histone deacetylase family protein [Pseudomonadota bacterium]HJP07147.1 histone deacetylase family protein [Arenicellales bacterium]|tara:strand:- start:9944 stop:10969 length:1026 start_codon:yes stop_codon:yes gene_type:complete
MRVIYSEHHRLRDAKTELYGGELVQPFERPSRADMVIKAVRNFGLGEINEPASFAIDPVLAVHDADFVSFLETAWDEWRQTGYAGEAMATVWPARRMQCRPPRFIEGKIGYYALAAETTITEGTWRAALASKDVALTGARGLLDGEGGIFSLCRPPGHHAARDMFGGYCFLNNAAIAAQYLRDQGAERVAILDVDFHHGNGTQDIFYERADVLFCSLHGDPEDAFPHFLGYADETGSGAGQGYNRNYPMPPGTLFSQWQEALADALAHIGTFSPQYLVVSLGVDTFENDPISFFKLTTPDYLTIGEMIDTLGIPTLFVLEGGYDIDEVGINAVNVLKGFEG